MFLDFTEDALHDLEKAAEWLLERDPDAARMFTETMKTALPALAEEIDRRIAEGSPPTQADEGATLFFSRPVFLELVTATRSGRRVRRSPAATWRVFYELRDVDDDKRPDVLRVLAVRHAAAQPLGVDVTKPDE